MSFGSRIVWNIVALLSGMYMLGALAFQDWLSVGVCLIYFVFALLALTSKNSARYALLSCIAWFTVFISVAIVQTIDRPYVGVIEDTKLWVIIGIVPLTICLIVWLVRKLRK